MNYNAGIILLTNFFRTPIYNFLCLHILLIHKEADIKQTPSENKMNIFVNGLYVNYICDVAVSSC
jgi:hypothetical protein